MVKFWGGISHENCLTYDISALLSSMCLYILKETNDVMYQDMKAHASPRQIHGSKDKLTHRIMTGRKSLTSVCVVRLQRLFFLCFCAPRGIYASRGIHFKTIILEIIQCTIFQQRLTCESLAEIETVAPRASYHSRSRWPVASERPESLPWEETWAPVGPCEDRTLRERGRSHTWWPSAWRDRRGWRRPKAAESTVMSA